MAEEFPQVPTVMIPAEDGPQFLSARGQSTPMRAVKLGRVRPKSRPAKPRMNAIFDPAKVPTPPTTTTRREKATASIKRMYVNDRLGCCVISGKYHGIGVWTGNDTPTCVVVDDQTIVTMYNRLKAGPGDSGCVVTDVLDFWQQSGLPVGGKVSKLDGYVSVDWRSKLEVQVAVYLFGRLTLAIDLPAEWASNGTIWDTPQTNIVGGHDIDIVDYNESGVTISTWGGTRLLTWRRLTALNNNTELYAMVGADWYNEDLLSPTGLTVETLKARLQILGGNDLPPIDPDVPPVPPAPPVPPSPPVPPVPSPTPIVLHGSGQTAPFSFTVREGVFGTRTITIPGQTVPVTVSSANAEPIH